MRQICERLRGKCADLQCLSDFAGATKELKNHDGRILRLYFSSGERERERADQTCVKVCRSITPCNSRNVDWDARARGGENCADECEKKRPLQRDATLLLLCCIRCNLIGCRGFNSTTTLGTVTELAFVFIITPQLPERNK